MMEGKIKVLHVIYDLSVAGAQTVVMNYLRKEAESEQFEFAMLVTEYNKNTPYDIEAKEKGFKVFYANYHPIKCVPILQPVMNWLRYQRKILHCIRKYRPEIIHIHGTKLLTYTVFPVMLSGVKKRCHTLHSDPYAVPNRYVPIAKIAFNKLNFAPICVTEQQAEKAAKRYNLKEYVVVRNGIDFSRFENLDSVEQIRTELGIQLDSFVVGYAGRLDKVKNLEFLFKVFKALISEHENARLVLAGTGLQEQHLRELAQELEISDKVIFLGLRNDIERVYKAMDVFALTSFFESSSIVTVEAQVAGIRAVISDNVPENVIVSNEVVRLSLDAPVEKWVEALLGKGKNEQRVIEMQQYSLDNSVSELEKIYRGMYR